MIVEALGNADSTSHEPTRGAGDHREAVRHVARRGPRTQPARARQCSRSPRSSASTTTWARRRSRTCWRSASPTACSSRCGIATTSTSVQITAAEDIGIGSRAGYYDHAGALRDLIQNHMLQLLCHVAMEPPVNFTADEVRNEKVKVLQAIARRAARTRSTRWRSAHSTPQATRAARRGRLPGRAGRAGGLEHRDLRGAAPRGRQLALGGRALLPAHRQAPGAQGDRDRRHAEAGAPPCLQPGRLARACSPTSWSSRCSPTRGCRCVSEPRFPERA